MVTDTKRGKPKNPVSDTAVIGSLGVVTDPRAPARAAAFSCRFFLTLSYICGKM